MKSYVTLIVFCFFQLLLSAGCETATKLLEHSDADDLAKMESSEPLSPQEKKHELEGQISDLDGEISTVDSYIQSTQDKIHRLEKQTTTDKETQISGAKAELDQFENQKADLLSRRAFLNSQLNSLQQ